MANSLDLAFSTALVSVIGVIPQFLGGIMVFLIGLILSGWGKSLVFQLLKAVNLNTLKQNSALNEFLNRAEIHFRLDKALAEIVRWLILYVFTIAALNVVGLTVVSDFLSGILSYIPSVINALIIIVIGVLVAGFMESLVKSAVAPIDLASARLMGKIASYTVFVFASLFAVSELGIARQYIMAVFIGFVAMLSLGFGLAIGLGAKDLVKEMLTKWSSHFYGKDPIDR